MKNSKAQGQIITVILLILLVFAVGTILFNFAIPFVQDKLESTQCVDLMGAVEIPNNKYTCYNISNEKLSFQISLKEKGDLIGGYKIELGGSSSNSFELTGENVEMFNGGDFELPPEGGARTYNISNLGTKPDSIKLYPILKNGDVCDAATTIYSESIFMCDFN